MGNCSALLYFKNLSEKSHFCLLQAIRTLYVEKRLISVTLIEALHQAKQLREEADYYNRWSEVGCKKLLDAAEEFIIKAKELVR